MVPPAVQPRRKATGGVGSSTSCVLASLWFRAWCVELLGVESTGRRSEFFFYIALFFSYFRTRHCLQVITEVGHLIIRRTRERDIVSGLYNIAPFEAWPRMPEHLSHPPDASGGKLATSAAWRGVAPAGCECMRMLELRFYL
jgi:hypothetical protein